MTEILLSCREVTATGLYVMRWKGRTGLVRIIGQPRTGWRTLPVTEKSVETLMPGLPEDGSIPPDAYLSEPLNLVVS